MYSDEQKRDIGDRLQWQANVQQALRDVVSVPLVYDCFIENGDTYLVMQYIKASPLTEKINQVYKNRHWALLDLPERKEIIKIAIEIVEMVSKMHGLGFVHRDLNTDNLLYDGSLHLIDLELVYSMYEDYPNPPFRWGTVGFMSPEQQASQKPAYAEDYFALGAMLTFMFSGLQPTRFDQTNSEICLRQLHFFLGDAELAKTLARSFSENASDRPGATELRVQLERKLGNMSGAPAVEERGFDVKDGFAEVLTETIEGFIAGLAGSQFSDGFGLWASPYKEEEKLSYYQNERSQVLPGFGSGVAGICFFLSRAHDAGFSIRECMPMYGAGIDLLRNYVLQAESSSRGFYSGAEGALYAILDGQQAGLNTFSQSLRELLIKGPGEGLSDGLSIAKGYAGMGLTWLKALNCVDDQYPGGSLKAIVDIILERQLKDGSWLSRTDDGNSLLKMTGIDHGIAGICCFLSAYASRTGDEAVKVAIHKGLTYLITQAKVKRQVCSWSLHNKTREMEPSLHAGFVGVLLAFIYGYQVTQDKEFTRVVEKGFANFPRLIVAQDITLAGGVAGLGEVYLDAWRVFGDEEWHWRASWIAQTIVNQTRSTPEGTNFWQISGNVHTNADLFFGNTGIGHFLLRMVSANTGNLYIPG